MTIGCRCGGVSRNRAVLAIREMGTNAVPCLVKMLNRKDSKIIVQLQDWVSTLAYRAGLDWRPHIYHRRDYDWHTMALEGLDALGDDAKPCLPALTSYVVRDPDARRLFPASRYDSLILLWKLNPESDVLSTQDRVDIAMEILTFDRKTKDRCLAIETLGRMGDAAKRYQGWIWLSLKDKSIPVRIAATNALKRIDPVRASENGVQ